MKKSEIILISVLASILVVVIIATLVILPKTAKESVTNETNEVVDVSTLDINQPTLFTDTYKENNLNVSVQRKSNGSVTSCSFSNDDRQSVKNIQNEVSKLIEKYSDEKYYINLNLTGNFSNILSLLITINDAQDNNKKVGSYYLNTRLDTGEKLNFGDLFISNEDAKKVFENSLNNIVSSLKNKNKYLNSEELQTYVSQNISDFENGKEYQFTVSPNEITIYNLTADRSLSVGDVLPTYLKIDLTNYAEYTNIFKKFSQDMKSDSNEILAFMPLGKNGNYNKVNDQTILIQYFPDEFDEYSNFCSTDIQEYNQDYEKMDNSNLTRAKIFAADVLKDALNNDSYKVIVQNIYISKSDNKIHISQEVYKMSDEFFNSSTFTKEIADAKKEYGFYDLNFSNSNVETEAKFYEK